MNDQARMTDMSGDVLQPVPDAVLPKLRDMYKMQLPRATYVYNYLSSVIKLKSQRPDNNYVTLMAPYGNWEDGTFVSVYEYSCYQLFMFTLERDCKTLCEALINTKKIAWNRRILLYAVYGEHYDSVLNALEKTTYRYYQTNHCGVWWIPKEKALKFEIDCPSEVYVEKLNTSHAATINAHWPHQYEDSDKYIVAMIEINGGYGVFLKSDGTLVAWVLRSPIGLGTLQTADEHKRKGYGSLITKVLAKELAKEGFDPLGTVLKNNTVSQAMFSKLGFEEFETVAFVENQEMRNILHNEN